MADTKAKSAALSWELSDKQANFPAKTEGYTLRSKKSSSSVKKRQGEKNPKHLPQKATSEQPEHCREGVTALRAITSFISAKADMQGNE